MSPFLEQLQAFVDARRAASESFVLLLVDCGIVGRLDANWGYGVGDAAHDFFASRLQAEALREQDLLIAAGRGEFACALASVDDAGVALLAAEKLLRALDTPVWIGEDEIFADGAVGIAMPAGPDDDAATLLGQASQACRLATTRSARATVFSPAEAGDEFLRLPAQSRLRAAMVQESLEFLFRPQRDLRTDMLVGAEGLLGWSGGAVQVRDAVATLRAARRVNEATRWAVSAALRHCTELRQGCGLDLRVSVNLSALDLQLHELAESILGLMTVWNLRPSRLTLGIADAAVLLHRRDARDLLHALGAAGVRLALEDQAAGLTVLAQLDALHFAEMRLDVASLGDLAGSSRRQSIARALIEMAHQSGLEVLADGVADAATADCLKLLGCDILQGDHIGQLVTAQGFIAAHQQ